MQPGNFQSKYLDDADEEEPCDYTPDDIDSDVLLSDGELNALLEPGNATYLLDKAPMYSEDEHPRNHRPIPRQVSTYQEMKREEDSDEDELGVDTGDTDKPPNGKEREHRMKRPKAARPRRGRAATPNVESVPSEEPHTPYGSEDNTQPIDKVDGDDIYNDDKDTVVEVKISKKKKKMKTERKMHTDDFHDSGKGKMKTSAYPKTSTPKSSPNKSPKKDGKHAPYVNKNTETGKPLHRNKDKEHDIEKQNANVGNASEKVSPKKGLQVNKKEKEMAGDHAKFGNGKGSITEQNLKKMADMRKQSSKDRNQRRLEKKNIEMVRQDFDAENTKRNKKEKKNDVYSKSRRRSRDLGSDDSPNDQSVSPKTSKDKVKYRNDDYAHEKIKSKSRREVRHSGSSESDKKFDRTDNEDAYYKKKKPYGVGDRRKRSSFTSMLDNQQVFVYVEGAHCHNLFYLKDNLQWCCHVNYCSS